MNGRRRFLRDASLLAASAGVLPGVATAPVPAAPRAAVRPRRLRAGDTVGLVSPSGVTWEPVRLEIARESLAAMGLRSKVAPNAIARHGYLAGTDAERAADLNAMFADPEVAAIHCIRGGWGCARLLPLIDWDTVAANPKALTGYSDITGLLLPLQARTGLVGFHGPNADSKWNAFNAGWFRRVVLDGEAVTFENVRETGEYLAVTENRVQTITPGRARGRLLGGNLTVLTALVGTPFLPDWDGCVLFVEDVEEAPYRIDRMLVQLKLAGILQKARAVIWGTCADCDPGEGFGSLTITDVLNDHVKPLGVPAWEGAMIGHVERQFTLPVGVEVEVDAAAGTIRMIEPAVV